MKLVKTALLPIGSLVRYAGNEEDAYGRSTGILLQHSVHHPDDCRTSIPIVEVLWDKGPGWIDSERVAVLTPVNL